LTRILILIVAQHGFAAQRLMSLEVGGLTGTGYGEKSDDRLAQRNGYRERDWETGAGTKQRQVGLALEQARYEAARMRRQYDAVDPDNRLVTGELERRWNVALSRPLSSSAGSVRQDRPAAVQSGEGPIHLALGRSYLAPRRGTPT
jgi:hypothetical protein